MRYSREESIEKRRRILDALPGTVNEIAARVGVAHHVVRYQLSTMTGCVARIPGKKTAPDVFTKTSDDITLPTRQRCAELTAKPRSGASGAQVRRLIKRLLPATVRTIAEAIGMSDAGVRRHLKSMAVELNSHVYERKVK